MSTEIATCSCTAWTDETVVRHCPEHRHYFRGATQLAGVNRVINTVWPIKKNWEDADPYTLENARKRGVATDDLFSAWLNGNLSRFPVGTRFDARDRFIALGQWWPSLGLVKQQAQTVLADDEIVGIADVVAIRSKTGRVLIADLKNVSALDPTYQLALGGYADLHEKQYGILPGELGLIHVTQPKGKPVSIKFVEVDLQQAVSDWRITRDMWRLVQRRTNGKLEIGGEAIGPAVTQ